MFLGGVLAMTTTIAHAQSTQSYAENSQSHSDTRPNPIEPVAPTTTPVTQPAAGHIPELAQLKSVTLLAVLPYFSSLALLAQLSTVEKESLALKLQADIGKCETPACLVSVQMELNRILMDRVVSLYKNVGWSMPKALSEPSR